MSKSQRLCLQNAEDNMPVAPRPSGPGERIADNILGNGKKRKKKKGKTPKPYSE